MRSALRRSRERAPSRLRESGGDRFLSARKRVADSIGVLPPRFGERRATPAAAADVLAELANELRRIAATADARLVEIDDEIRTSVVDRCHDHAVRLFLLAHAVGEISKRSALERFRLHEEHVAFLVHDGEIDARVLSGTFGLFARTLELRAQLVRLAGAFVEPGECLAARQRLDPPGSRADGSLRENREGTDLGGRAHVGAATELARIARHLDDADDVAVLLAEQHHRPEATRLLNQP